MIQSKTSKLTPRLIELQSSESKPTQATWRLIHAESLSLCDRGTLRHLYPLPHCFTQKIRQPYLQGLPLRPSVSSRRCAVGPRP